MAPKKFQTEITVLPKLVAAHRQHISIGGWRIIESLTTDDEIITRLHQNHTRDVKQWCHSVTGAYKSRP